MSSIISVSNLSKAYRIGTKDERADSFVGMLQNAIIAPIRNWNRLRDIKGSEDTDDSVHWALRDVSFEIEEGDVVGVMGRNGAGKSTLLKILSRITEPSSGVVRVKGRIASLLEVGTGFHPELSGRENVYLNGTILGMHKREIDKKFDEIVDFSGVEKFLDTPIKRYSSGMKVRLAFAVAAHLDPEILIVDEVLAVGDTDFQRKCMGKMKEVSTGGKTVVFVSHNIQAVKTLCKSGLILSHGALQAIGPVEHVAELYSDRAESNRSTSWGKSKESKPSESTWIDFVKIELSGEQPHLCLKVEMLIRRKEKGEDKLILSVDIHGPNCEWLMQAVPDISPTTFAGDETQVEILVHLPPLIPGVYPVGVWIGKSLNYTVDWLKEVVQFEVSETPTPGRTIPHSSERGFCVPVSEMTFKRISDANVNSSRKEA